LLGVLTAICGCDPQPRGNNLAKIEQALPADLRRMQGDWHIAESNQFDFCTVSIENYKLQLRFRQGAEDIELKRNACIKELIPEQRQLLVHNDKKPWFYEIQRVRDVVQLNLRFYNTPAHEWVQVQLVKSRESGSGIRNHKSSGL